MSGTALLDRLAAAGVTVRPDPAHGDRLRLAPPDRLTPDLLELVKRNKPARLAALRERSRPTPEQLNAWGEYLLERAAIMEHDGALPRAEADRRAWAELLSKYPDAATHFLPGGAS
jgi:hypothetical protein